MATQDDTTTVKPSNPPGLNALIASLVGSVGTNSFAAALLVWVVVYQIPDQNKAFVEELRLERESRERSMQVMHELAVEVRALRKSREE